MIRKVHEVNLDISIRKFLKTHKENNDILTIALWSIYKMRIIRNKSGKDERRTKLWWIFLEELKTRIDINIYFMQKGKPIFCLICLKR